jgi:Glu-tRNA(Gln) amidotransferase subunit E-like FAD-binding protein
LPAYSCGRVVLRLDGSIQKLSQHIHLDDIEIRQPASRNIKGKASEVFVNQYGLPLAETGRRPRVSTGAIAKALDPKGEQK